MSQGLGQRVCGQRLCAPRCVPLDARGERGGSVRFTRSAKLPSSFCGKCGSPVPHSTRSGREIIIPAGSLDDDPGATPATNVHWSSRAGWSLRSDAGLGIPVDAIRRQANHLDTLSGANLALKTTFFRRIKSSRPENRMGCEPGRKFITHDRVSANPKRLGFDQKLDST